MTAHAFYRSEIQDRITKGYLERLSKRLQKMRRHLVERNWEDLRTDCASLKYSASNFGFTQLSEKAETAEHSIPNKKGIFFRAYNNNDAQRHIEELFSLIEQTLIANSSGS